MAAPPERTTTRHKKPLAGEDKQDGASIGSEAKTRSTPRSRHSRSYVAAQQAHAARRDREEWLRTRGAGSNVLLWFEELKKRRSDKVNRFGWTAADVVPPVENILKRTAQPCEVTGMDCLLDWGICDYTIMPKTLGRGRFSTVYLAIKNGQRYAIKHTPLFPHHELVATRLLREPTLLAEIPPHPNLVTVVETIRTPGHFYLVEEYLDGYVTLESLISTYNQDNPSGPHKLPEDVACKILAQLVMALHAIHTPLRVCHRDVKPENVLVHPETLQLKLLDFGLATHFSRSHAKLTTCCGSPAFHCPEIVAALSHPLGTVTYWGPEVDAWTCGITLLRCLSGIRYPLGTSHTSPASMGVRAQRVLSSLPPSQLRDDVAGLLDLQAEARMRHFDQLAERVEAEAGMPSERQRRELKCTSFVPAPPQHAMVLPLVLTSEALTQATANMPLGMDMSHFSMITLLNTSLQPSQRVLSFIRYCFRCAGILYHTVGVAYQEDEPDIMRLGTAAPSAFDAVRSCAFQCVVELIEDEEPGMLTQMMQSFFSLFGRQATTEELVKLPQRAIDPDAKHDSEPPSSGPSGKQGPLCMLVCYVVVTFPDSGTDTPKYPEFETPAPEMIAEALQNRFAPIKKETALTRQGTAEEPNLRIDTRVERLPPPQIVKTSPQYRTRSRSRARSLQSRAPRGVHVYVSDARAVPYIRGALSNGGVLRSESLASSTSSRVQSPSARWSGSETPVPDTSLMPATADAMGPHELDTSLDAIEGTCRSLLVRRVMPGRADTDHEHAQRLYMLVSRLYRRLERSLQGTHSDALRIQMSERNFRALDVLGPTLALVSEHDTVPRDAHTNTGSVALAVLELFSACSSAKEMCLGFQEQIERLSLAWRSRDDVPVSGADRDAVTMLARDAPMLVQAVIGQLQRLANVLPAIRTRRPKATVESVLGLVYPTLYRDVLCDALGMIAESDTHEELATQAAIVLCELVLSLRPHAESMEEPPNLGGMLTDALYELLRFLPRATREAPDVSPRITVWNIVRKTYEQLGVDLGCCALGTPDTNRAALAVPSARHAFVLFVHQLAYESFMSRMRGRSRRRLRIATQKGTALAEPQRWAPDTAREMLVRLAGVLPGTLMPGLGPLDVPIASRTMMCVHDTLFCECLVLFLDWIEHALPPDVMSDDDITYTVRALAVVATYATQAADARPRSFDVMRRLVRDHSSDDATLRIVRECMSPTAPVPLRGATVHLLRDIIARRLDKVEHDHGHDALLDDGRLWRVWNDELLVVPSSLPPPPKDGGHAAPYLDELAAYLVQHQTYLQECLSLFYFVTVRDAAHNVTGVHDEREYQRLYRRFVQPLASWVESWRPHVPEGELSLRLSLLETAISRI